MDGFEKAMLDWYRGVQDDAQYRCGQRNLNKLMILLTQNGYATARDPWTGNITVNPTLEHPLTIALDYALKERPEELLAWVKERFVCGGYGLNNIQLMDRASKAAYDYRVVYDIFPKKIGIHIERQKLFNRMHISLLNTHPADVFSLQYLKDTENIAVHRHEAYFEGVVGPFVQWDGVYLPHPLYIRRAIDHTKMAAMAHDRQYHNYSTITK